MPLLPNSKHERFAQLIAKGGKLIESFVSAGYSKASAASNAARLMVNDGVSSRINELRTVIAAGVVDSEIRKRNHRVQVLQGNLNRMLALIEARSVMYGEQMGEGRRWIVHDEVEELQAISEGFSEEKYPDKPPLPGYPKHLFHPGYPNGGATGMLVKDYRGKNAEQEIWKFDGALVAQINDVLKQAAIEEGQWTEKRELQGNLTINLLMDKINAGRKRVAEAKLARDAAVYHDVQFTSDYSK